jgi:MFS transporter, DHA1 family, multidrug resistance protein
MVNPQGDLETTPLLLPRDDAASNSNLVELSGPDDPLNPQILPQWRKWLCASILGAMTFAATFASSVFSAVADGITQEFRVSREVVILAMSLFVFGFATGPVLMGPASELYGRKLPLFAGYIAFILFQIPVGMAQDVQTILIFRFLGGVASAGSPAIVGGYMADFLAPVERGAAVAIFAATTLIGPAMGVIVGNIIMQSSLSWRWAAWLPMIMGAVFGIAGWFILPETYVPVLLKRKAQKLRFQTKNWALHSKLEETPVTGQDFVVRYLSRPLFMLVQEPILVVLTLYISFTFGMVYLLFVVSSVEEGLERFINKTARRILSVSPNRGVSIASQDLCR